MYVCNVRTTYTDPFAMYILHTQISLQASPLVLPLQDLLVLHVYVHSDKLHLGIFVGATNDLRHSIACVLM